MQYWSFDCKITLHGWNYYQNWRLFSFRNNGYVVPVAEVEWTACPLTVQEVSQSNPGNLPLLHACRERDRQPCWPLYSQQVSHQRWISGIHGMQATKHASKGSTLALKPRGDVIRSPKQGYQWPHKKDSFPPKILKKTKKKQWICVPPSNCVWHITDEFDLIPSKLFVTRKSSCVNARGIPPTV